MEITLYNFTKRRNSTKRPSKGILVNVNLKEGCSHYNPSFILTTNPTNYSYLSWGTWYYYISDIVNTRNGVWTISCEIDVLATWKDDIKSTSAYVLYSSSNYNTDLIDSRLSSAKNAIINTSSANLSLSLHHNLDISFLMLVLIQILMWLLLIHNLLKSCQK